MQRKVDMQLLDRRLRLSLGDVRRCIRALDESAECRVPPGELGLAWVDPASCSRLHADFFGDPGLTDVMTFPGEAGDDHAGELAICPAVAAARAAEFANEFSRELTLYLVHGWLHLAGFQDATRAGRQRMRRAESKLLAWLESRRALLPARWDEHAPDKA